MKEARGLRPPASLRSSPLRYMWRCRRQLRGGEGARGEAEALAKDPGTSLADLREGHETRPQAALTYPRDLIVGMDGAATHGSLKDQWPGRDAILDAKKDQAHTGDTRAAV